VLPIRARKLTGRYQYYKGQEGGISFHGNGSIFIVKISIRKEISFAGELRRFKAEQINS
jgi:hypothetical protein